MLSLLDVHYLAPAGSTGTLTTGATSFPVPHDSCVAFQFVVEATGSTPTITYKFQGSLDGTNWYDVAYITDASDTSAVTATTVTSTGSQVFFLSNSLVRKYRFYRVQVTANTNVTYRAEMRLSPAGA